jgi:hypothetical protein
MNASGSKEYPSGNGVRNSSVENIAEENIAEEFAGALQDTVEGAKTKEERIKVKQSAIDKYRRRDSTMIRSNAPAENQQNQNFTSNAQKWEIINKVAVAKTMERRTSQRGSVKTAAPCVIHGDIRHHYIFLCAWDWILAVSLIWVAFALPVEVGFLTDSVWSTDSWFANVMIATDLVFVCDMVLRFFVAYQDHTTGVYVTKHSLIAKRYAKTWLFVDVVSMIPVEVILNRVDPEQAINNAHEGGSQSRMLRLLRLMKLLRLLRLFQASRLAGRLQAAVHISFLTRWLTRFALTLVVVSHWMACGIGIAATLNEENGMSWKHEYARMYYPDVVGVNRFDDFEHFREAQLEFYYYYIGAYYWAVMSLTSIGYGDIVAVSTAERIVVTGLMISGGLVWAVVLGNIAGLFSVLCKEDFHFGVILDDLNSALVDHGVDYALRMKMRSFMHRARRTLRRKDYSEVLDYLSTGLQGEYALALHSKWINEIPWLEYASENFVTMLFRSVDLNAHEQSEFFGRGRTMYYNRSGLVARNFKILPRRASWGWEQLIFSAPPLLQRFRVLALTFTEVFSIHKNQLDLCFQELPGEWHSVRRSTLRLLFKATGQHFIREERRRLEKENKANGNFSFLDVVAAISGNACVTSAAVAQRESEEDDEENAEDELKDMVKLKYPGPPDSSNEKIMEILARQSDQI